MMTKFRLDWFRSAAFGLLLFLLASCGGSGGMRSFSADELVPFAPEAAVRLDVKQTRETRAFKQVLDFSHAIAGPKSDNVFALIQEVVPRTEDVIAGLDRDNVAVVAVGDFQNLGEILAARLERNGTLRLGSNAQGDQTIDFQSSPAQLGVDPRAGVGSESIRLTGGVVANRYFVLTTGDGSAALRRLREPTVTSFFSDSQKQQIYADSFGGAFRFRAGMLRRLANEVPWAEVSAFLQDTTNAHLFGNGQNTEFHLELAASDGLAAAAARRLKSELGKLSSSPMVKLLGVSDLLKELRITSSSELLRFDLELSKEQTDLVFEKLEQLASLLES